MGRIKEVMETEVFYIDGLGPGIVKYLLAGVLAGVAFVSVPAIAALIYSSIMAVAA